MRFKTRLKSSVFLIDLTPLVDVIFLMLIFFIITSDILPLKSLQIENPQLTRDSAPLTTQLLVVMDAQNVIYLGSRKDIVDLTTLKNNLLDEIGVLKKQHPSIDPTVVLSIDRRVDYGAFLRLFSIAQECGTRLRLVYKPEDEQHANYF
jgi:biopolymer transport protein ExbD